jgi:hypothetical protein
MRDSLYPDFPGSKVSGPSEEVAKAISTIVGTLRDRVREVIIKNSDGITADEIALELNRSVLSIRPRVSELRRLGEICQAEARGRNESGMSASKWIIAPPLQPEDPDSDQSEVRA